MTFLPIVQRELLVAARRRSTYRMRIGVALVAMLLAIGSYFAVNVGWQSPAGVGKNLFHCVAVFALAGSLFAGLGTTADSISREKREGTLGFLFLTDLRSYDVVLGKCFATSLSSFFAIVTIAPVLGISLLLGGVTPGEIWRAMLVALISFLFSISAGMFVSAITRDTRNAIGGTFALILLFTLVAPACGYLVKANAASPGPGLFLSHLSPVSCFLLAADNQFSAQPELFWTACSAVIITSLIFLTLAIYLLPRVWQDNPKNNGRSPMNRRPGAIRSDSPRKKRWREKLLNQNPALWLAARDDHKRVSLWVGVVIGALFAVGVYLYCRQSMERFPVMLVCAFTLHAAVKFLIAIDASHGLADERRSGALELLLATPLSPLEILQGHLFSLRRKFFLVIVGVLVLDACWLFDGLITLDLSSDELMLPVSFLGAMLMLMVDAYTLSWVGLCLGLVAKTSRRAFLTTMFQILLLPWVGIMALLMCLALLTEGGISGIEPGWLFVTWFGMSVMFNLLFFGLATNNFFNHFRSHAVMTYDSIKRF